MIYAIYIRALEDEGIQGVYNAVAPDPVRNKTFIQVLAKVLGRPHFLPPVPGFVCKLLLGSRSALVLDSTRVFAQKLIEAGFHFKYPDLENGLKSIYTNSI